MQWFSVVKECIFFLLNEVGTRVTVSSTSYSYTISIYSIVIHVIFVIDTVFPRRVSCDDTYRWLSAHKQYYGEVDYTTMTHFCVNRWRLTGSSSTE